MSARGAARAGRSRRRRLRDVLRRGQSLPEGRPCSRDHALYQKSLPKPDRTRPTPRSRLARRHRPGTSRRTTDALINLGADCAGATPRRGGAEVLRASRRHPGAGMHGSGGHAGQGSRRRGRGAYMVRTGGLLMRRPAGTPLPPKLGIPGPVPRGGHGRAARGSGSAKYNYPQAVAAGYEPRCGGPAPGHGCVGGLSPARRDCGVVGGSRARHPTTPSVSR